MITKHPARPPSGTACGVAGSRRRSLRLVTIGGCLAMVYGVGIGSPATTEFFRAIGANEFHFGLITGIPLIMLLMQSAAVLPPWRVEPC